MELKMEVTFFLIFVRNVLSINEYYTGYKNQIHPEIIFNKNKGQIQKQNNPKDSFEQSLVSNLKKEDFPSFYNVEITKTCIKMNLGPSKDYIMYKKCYSTIFDEDPKYDKVTPFDCFSIKVCGLLPFTNYRILVTADNNSRDLSFQTYGVIRRVYVISVSFTKIALQGNAYYDSDKVFDDYCTYILRKLNKSETEIERRVDNCNVLTYFSVKEGQRYHITFFNSLSSNVDECTICIGVKDISEFFKEDLVDGNIIVSNIIYLYINYEFDIEIDVVGYNSSTNLSYSEKLYNTVIFYQDKSFQFNANDVLSYYKINACIVPSIKYNLCTHAKPSNQKLCSYKDIIIPKGNFQINGTALYNDINNTLEIYFTKPDIIRFGPLQNCTVIIAAMVARYVNIPYLNKFLKTEYYNGWKPILSIHKCNQHNLNSVEVKISDLLANKKQLIKLGHHYDVAMQFCSRTACINSKTFNKVYISLNNEDFILIFANTLTSICIILSTMMVLVMFKDTSKYVKLENDETDETKSSETNVTTNNTEHYSADSTSNSKNLDQDKTLKLNKIVSLFKRRTIAEQGE